MFRIREIHVTESEKYMVYIYLGHYNIPTKGQYGYEDGTVGHNIFDAGSKFKY